MLSFLGSIPFDSKLRKAIQHQRAVVDAFPHSPASLAFKRITKQINNWPLLQQTDGQLKFFVERMIQSNMVQANIHKANMLQSNLFQPEIIQSKMIPHSMFPQEVS